jgi:sugar phosphate isomerase/epimerase
MPEILDGLAEAGYEAVEAMHGHPPADRPTVERAGLSFTALHIGASLLEPLDPLVAFLQSVGATDVCSSGPLVWNQRSIADYRATAKVLNEKGRRLRDLGIHLHYHNHEFEFEPVDGQMTGMAVLLDELDAANVTLCLDAGWVWTAGQDPVGFLRENGDRVGFLHLRDFQGRESVALGRGEMDLAAVVAVARELPELRVLGVEQDPTTPTPLEDMQHSRRYLRDELGL